MDVCIVVILVHECRPTLTLVYREGVYERVKEKELEKLFRTVAF